VATSVECSDGPPLVEGSHILLATGRVPNTQDLGLQAAGIRTDERGYIVVDEGLATGVEGVYALGDCNGRGAFTHTSWNDYEIVAANLFDGASRKVGDRIPAYALFIDPPLGRVGMTETQVRASGRPALVAKMPMTRVGRAREMRRDGRFHEDRGGRRHTRDSRRGDPRCARRRSDPRDSRSDDGAPAA
jgi:pyruvate/2-oxoglutarate dehydrogenase complex dihydrolipoamide dehydrogenase (E3) component